MVTIIFLSRGEKHASFPLHSKMCFPDWDCNGLHRSKMFHYKSRCMCTSSSHKASWATNMGAKLTFCSLCFHQLLSEISLAAKCPTVLRVALVCMWYMIYIIFSNKLWRDSLKTFYEMSSQCPWKTHLCSHNVSNTYPQPHDNNTLWNISSPKFHNLYEQRLGKNQQTSSPLKMRSLTV